MAATAAETEVAATAAAIAAAFLLAAEVSMGQTYDHSSTGGTHRTPPHGYNVGLEFGPGTATPAEPL